MSLIASLHIGDPSIEFYTNSYLIEECNFTFLNHSSYLFPTGETNYGKIFLVLRKPTDLRLHEWYINQDKLGGKIEIELSSYNEPEKRILVFEEAQCYSLIEEYDKKNNAQVLLKLEFVAEDIRVAGVEFHYLKQ